MCKFCQWCIFKSGEFLCLADDEEILIDGENSACEDFKRAKRKAENDPRITVPRK